MRPRAACAEGSPARVRTRSRLPLRQKASCQVPVAGLVGDLHAVVGENCLDLIGHGFEHVLQEIQCGGPVSLFVELGHSKLARVVISDEKALLSFSCLRLGDAFVEGHGGVTVRYLPPRLVSTDIKQT